ncbi:MAG TPA: extracellular solute-binding protein [Actinomycetota bacterium]
MIKRREPVGGLREKVRVPRVHLALAALLTLLGGACTPQGIGGEPVTVPPPPATTGVPDSGPVTLTVWDQETGQVSKVWDRLNAEFEQHYPNVTIDRVNVDFGELKTLLKLAVSGPNAPDIVEANQGWPDMGGLVRAGLLLPLDNYAEAYGWIDRVPAAVRAVSSWTPDGREFGTGNLFGYTSLGEILGVYYNKQKLAALGLTVPTTFAAFEQALATAKSAGEVPIQFANNAAFPGIHEFVMIQDQMAAPQDLTDFIFGDRAVNPSFDTPENVQAAATLQDWAKAGYFTPGFGGTGYETSIANFAKGEGLFMITGNWIVADLGADNADFGFFPMPPMEAGDPPVSTGGAGFPLSITVGSQHPDAAAAYIDFMTNDHATSLLLRVGQLPLSTGDTSAEVEPGTLLADVVGAANAVAKANGVVPYEDWATPTFYDTLSASIQELMAERLTPQEFVAKVQDDYAEFQESRP